MDADCPGGRCVDGECLVNDCNEGDERPCTTECGDGNQTCRGGVWRPCNAGTPTAEVCGDGRDNDCDSRTDEECGGCVDGEERECSTECGTGNERCVSGQWRGCTAPRVRMEVCGNDLDEDCNGTVDDGCDNCENGAQRPCRTECGEGVETCIESTFQGCSAPTPVEEFCDNVDNDCDENVDEEVLRRCDNACGGGTAICDKGEWLPCDAPDACACDPEGADAMDLQVCGTCGFRQRACEEGMWGPWGECDEGTPQCRPGEVDQGACGLCGTRQRLCDRVCRWGDWLPCGAEGLCEPGEETIENCEDGCGERRRSCSNLCFWDEWSACEGGGDLGCSPGQTEEEICGNCGTRTRTCGDECRWGEWSDCGAEGVCAPGEEGGEACGNCGARVRVCGDTCEWGEFGECTEGGQCEPGGRDTRDCGNCGEQTRSCSEQCVWEDWNPCENEGPCSPGDTLDLACGSDVGECREGVAVQGCNGQCQWNDAGPCRDQVEPAEEICGNDRDEDCDGRDEVVLDMYDEASRNNRCVDCTWLNTEDDPDVNVTLFATLHNREDADFYCFHAHDGFSAPGFGEHIRIQLENIPRGSDYDVFLYGSLDDCVAREELARGVNGNNEAEDVDWVESIGSDNGGEYYVQVNGIGRSQSCFVSYELTINGLN